MPRLIRPVHCSCLLALAVASTGVVQGDAAQEFEEQGITLQPQAIRDLKWFERYRADLIELNRQLDAYQEAYKLKKDDAHVKWIEKQKRQCRLVQKNAPLYRPSLSFLAQLRDYKAGAEFKKSNQWIKAIRSSLPVYQKQVGYLVPPGTLSPGGDTGTAGTGTGGTAARPPKSVPGDWEVYIMGTSGDMEFFVNNQKVEPGRRSYPLNGVGKVVLRAVALGKKRKQAREFVPPRNTVKVAADDYQLHYQTKTGNFSGETHWQVDSETYTWTPTRRGNIGTEIEYADSGVHKSVKRDLAVFLFDRVFSYSANVKSEAKWKATSKRPGGTRTLEQADTAEGKISFSVGPKG